MQVKNQLWKLHNLTQSIFIKVAWYTTQYTKHESKSFLTENSNRFVTFSIFLKLAPTTSKTFLVHYIQKIFISACQQSISKSLY